MRPEENVISFQTFEALLVEWSFSGTVNYFHTHSLHQFLSFAQQRKQEQHDKTTLVHCNKKHCNSFKCQTLLLTTGTCQGYIHISSLTTD